MKTINSSEEDYLRINTIEEKGIRIYGIIEKIINEDQYVVDKKGLIT